MCIFYFDETPIITVFNYLYCLLSTQASLDQVSAAVTVSYDFGVNMNREIIVSN